MKSYTVLRNLYGSYTQNIETANLTLGDQLINDGHRIALGDEDWPFLHRIRTLTTNSPTSTVTVVAATDVITATDQTILIRTGAEVTFTTTDTLPAGLSTSTTYYMIYQSATTFKVATSLANAIAGTAIDITDTGTGTHTVNVATRTQALPYDVDQVESVYVTVSSTRYNPKPAPSRAFWQELNYSDQKSNIPEYWSIYDGEFGLWPRPSDDGNVITLGVKINVPDLNVADYTTGNIDIVTNGSISVTGAGTPAWTTPMAGRYLRVTHSNTAASSGDGRWYEISTIASATTLTLARAYGGRSLTTGAAASYIIGQMPALPEKYHVLPVYYASSQYWALQGNEVRVATFDKLFQEGLGQMRREWNSAQTDMVLDDGRDYDIINPNLTISL